MAEQQGTGRRTGRPPTYSGAMDGRAEAKAPKELIVAFNDAAADLGTNYSQVARAFMQFIVDHPDLLARVQTKAAANGITVSDLILGLLEAYAPPPPE